MIYSFPFLFLSLFRLVAGQVGHDARGKVGHLDALGVEQTSQHLEEGVHQEAGAQPGHLRNVVQQTQHLGLYRRLVREGMEDVQEQLHSFLVKEN